MCVGVFFVPVSGGAIFNVVMLHEINVPPDELSESPAGPPQFRALPAGRSISIPPQRLGVQVEVNVEMTHGRPFAE